MTERPRAMVLAAGLGTRLRPLTDEVPKPLCWVGDRSQIEHVFDALTEAGYQRAVVNTHHLAAMFDESFARRQALQLVISHEAQILGTAGGVQRAAPLLGSGDVLVWNADVLLEPDLHAFEAAHRQAAAAATLLVADSLPVGLGTVGLDFRGRVCRLRSFVRPGEVRGCNYAGVMLLSEQLRRNLPEQGCLVGDLLMPALERGEPVATSFHDADFIDTGSLDAYLLANQRFLRQRKLPNYVAASAQVGANVQLRDSVVGDFARLEGQGELVSCVVWPGARAVAPLERCVVTCRGVVTLAPPTPRA